MSKDTTTPVAGDEEPSDDPLGQHLMAVPVGKPLAGLMERLRRMIAGAGGAQIVDAGLKAHEARTDKAREN